MTIDVMAVNLPWLAFSPTLMHVRLDVAVIDRLQFGHRLRRQGGQCGGFRVRSRLRRVACAGNGDGDGVEHQYPSQRELRHRRASAQRAEFLDRRKTRFIGYVRESLADVEGLAVAIELAMVGILELRIGPELTGKKAAGERHARDYGDLFGFSRREKSLYRALAENVEDDLDAGHAGIFDCLQSLFDPLYADPVIQDLALFHQRVETLENFRAIIEVGGRERKLDEIERIDFQVFQAALDPGGQVRRGIAGDVLRRQPPARFGGDERPLAAPALQRARDQPFGMPVAIDIRRIDESDAERERFVERREGVAFVDMAPIGADRPGAEADFTHLSLCAPKYFRTHACPIGSSRKSRDFDAEPDSIGA